MNRVHLADNLEVLRAIDDESVDLIYIDPPFNTGEDRRHVRTRATRDEDSKRRGFNGRAYRLDERSDMRYADSFDDYAAFLAPRLEEAWRTLAAHGSIYVHLDWREVHHVKVMMDHLFGRDRFLNEIIWAYDYGGRPRTRWPAKHDNILVYVKSPGAHYFDIDAVERIPYMAPGLVGAEKAARGKTPTDTWWHTIVPTSGPERTGYPTQKPLGVLRRVVGASSPPGGHVLDFFAGSGTTGAACLELGRRFTLVDSNPEAIAVMRRRFEAAEVEWIEAAADLNRADDAAELHTISREADACR